MSAPSLPEIFGNYSLGDFVEVVSPEAISWWPQTTGWLVLFLALLFLAGQWLWRQLVHWHRNRYRREAIDVLKQSETGSSLAEINRLLKLTALAAFSREQVASLSGEPWVEFLNAQCEQAPFQQEQAALLAMASYTTTQPDQASLQRLLNASQTWVELHKNAADV